MWLARSNSIGSLETSALKNDLKLRREEFLGSVKEEARERLRKKYEQFGLRRVGAAHELFLLERGREGRREGESEGEQLNREL